MSTSKKGKRPKYWLKLTDKQFTVRRTYAGAAFENEFGQLNLVLNPGITISYKDDLFITLVPYDATDPPHLPTAKRDETAAGGDKNDGDYPF